MLNWLKWLLWIVLVVAVVATLSVYVTLRMSLPSLEGDDIHPDVSAPVSLARDSLGQAVITSANRQDAAFALGVAHGQDRFFQMDLQRRVAAGELAVWLGKDVISVDERARFHQFRKRAQTVISRLPEHQLSLLESYAKGVNTAIREYSAPPMEYLITGFDMQPWKAEDSILVIFSMYMDLQLGQVELDMARTALVDTFGDEMLAFINQPSQYQAALDGSELPVRRAPIPPLTAQTNARYTATEPPDIGSNNWAVTGELTKTGSAMLANDMHLGLRVPVIWYRAQLNYTRDNTPVQVTGVSLPGLPGIVVGTNGHIAWGFTNSNLDNVDWVALDDNSRTWQVAETIMLPQGEHSYEVTMSDYGPVQRVDGKRYALSWVAHQPYSVNLTISDLDVVKSVQDTIPVAGAMAIPAQNMLITDAQGNAAWTPGGAVTSRPVPSYTAISTDAYSERWNEDERLLPALMNPASHRLWSANSRVVSATQLERFGDGGYALGARGQQIRDRLFEKDIFNEQDFYAIQLDNEAKFLAPWHTLLVQTLNSAENVDDDLRYLQNWQKCACADSVGYTLVKAFRQSVMQRLLAPVMSVLEEKGVKTRQLLRQVEPALWQLLERQPDGWLPAGTKDWPIFLRNEYLAAKARLLADTINGDMAELEWGSVNALSIKHPFARQIPVIGHLLNMPVVPAFGDTFMPAVQSSEFGASQRFFVQPAHLEKAVMTIPGGQSGHPLSSFYHIGFSDYANQEATPLLPGDLIYTRSWVPPEDAQ